MDGDSVDICSWSGVEGVVAVVAWTNGWRLQKVGE